MNTTNFHHVSKNSLFPVITGFAFVLAVLVLFIPSKRQYSAPGIGQEGEEKDAEALGMNQYFFNIRKDIHTNTINYQAMLAADIADRQMSIASRNTHSASSGTSLKDFDWTSMGPTNIGGRTRAILIDNNDATHQTIFAGGVSGGIWKSTNAGSTWDNTSATLTNSINDTLSNMNVCSIAQGSDGSIYIGTGEGFTLDGSEGEMVSQGILGGGIFKSTDDGKTWTILPATVPTANNDAVNWAYTNRIVCQPNNPAVIYAAQNYGLEISIDTGKTWNYCLNSATNVSFQKLNSLDVKISQDGKVIVASVNGIGYYCYPSSSDNWQDNKFTAIKNTGAGALPHGFYLEFAISPTNPNWIYVSEISNATGGLGVFDSKSGIYFTETGKTGGGYWYPIGPGGTKAFDPYSAGGLQDQAVYDNDLAVDPSNVSRLILGGTTLFQWEPTSATDTIGKWISISNYDGFPIATYVHPDQHIIVFDLNDPDVVYFGNDGGVYKSLDGANTFAPYNRNYNVTQYYAITCSPQVDPTNQEGVWGGTQDNGSPYIPGTVAYYPQDASELIGGDGGGAVISQINPNIAIGTTDYGEFLGRTGSLTASSPPTDFYTKTKGDSGGGHGLGGGGNIDSIATNPPTTPPGCFVFPLALYENSFDLNNLDSISWTAPKNYKANQTAYPISPNGSVAFPYLLTSNADSGVTYTIHDPVVSKLAVAFTPVTGFWVTAQATDLSDLTIWIPFGGPNSTPDACKTGGSVHCLAWSPDGDALWGGTEDGYLYRFTNMNSIIGNKYMSGALWYQALGTSGNTYTSGNQVICNSVSLPVSGRDIMSIAIDPQNGNNMIVTLGNYNSTTYIYYTSNALAAAPIWTSAQGNLPAMPVYGSILDIKNGYGSQTWATNAAMVVTEHGVYTTNNINAASPAWIKNSKGLANVLTAGIKQQVTEPWNCNNSGDIYVGTHGRGIWYSASTFVPTSVQQVTSDDKIPFTGLNVYPNPMVNEGTLEYMLNSSESLNLSVFDIQGKEIQTQQLGTQTEGKHLIPLQGNNLKPGTYFVSLQGTDFRQVAKFVVVQ